jgi:hypothetical protein
MIRCWLRGHQPLLVQVRDDSGRPCRPHTLVWICRQCLKDLGDTVLLEDRFPEPPTWSAWRSSSSSRRSS